MKSIADDSRLKCPCSVNDIGKIANDIGKIAISQFMNSSHQLKTVNFTFNVADVVR